MNFTQYIKWSDGEVGTFQHFCCSQEEMVEMLERNIAEPSIVETWIEDFTGNQLAYFDGHVQLIEGEKELKKGTKEEVLDEVYDEVAVERWSIEDVLDVLEEYRYIEFKKEYKEYKVFVKTVIVYEGAKDLYYVTDSLYTDNIDEAKRFDLDEEKDGYAYEIVKESV